MADPISLKENKLLPQKDWIILSLLQTCIFFFKQVLNLDGEWVAAPPIDGTIVVNIGDMLQQWTADKLLSSVSFREYI